MGLLTRTTPAPEPTLHEQHNAALATEEAAMSVFAAFVGDVEYAGAMHASVALDCQNQIDELEALRDAACADSEGAINRARKIAELLGL